MLPLPSPQFSFVAALVPESALAGCVMVSVCVCEQPSLPVTVTVYVPAVRPVAVAAFPPVGDHAYVYGGDPEEAFTVAVPFAPPKHVTSAEDCNVTTGAPVFPTTAVVVVVHPFASVTVTLYVPPARPLIVDVDCELLQAYVYVPVPPAGVAVALPLLFPHVAGTDVAETVSCGGSVIVTVCSVGQLFMSVTVTVYVPAGIAVAVAEDPPEGDQLYVNGPLPVALTVAEPVVSPKQATSTLDCRLTVGPPVDATVVVPVVVQPFASVTVQVYEPAARLFAVDAVPPDGAQLYVYGPVPPLSVTEAVPVLVLHPVGVEVALALSAAGSVMVTVCVVVQPASSVIVQVYVPAPSPVPVAALPPAGDHAYV